MFTNRWMIEGTLTTRGPLHIGSGQTREDAAIRKTKEEAGSRETVEIAEIARDHAGRPYLPGSSLKGALRSWLEEHTEGLDESLERLFGSRRILDLETRDFLGEEHVAGRVVVYDALLDATQSTPEDVAFLPHWDEQLWTAIDVGVAIDRRLRTVVERKLFHTAFVPPGVAFQVRIGCENLDEHDIGLILMALAAFNEEIAPVQIGAANRSDWGRLRWLGESGAKAVPRISRIDATGVADWLKDPERCGFAAARPLNIRQIIPLLQQAELIAATHRRPDASVIIQIRLEFQGPFLVNDPSRVEKTASTENHNGDNSPDFIARRNQDDRPLLPASSFRGAFRAHAERIARTSNEEAAGDLHARDARGHGPLRQMEALHRQLRLIDQLFGATGWSSPLSISDFVAVHTCEKFIQQFVAIDRFSGGAADGALFKCEAYFRPILEGTVRVDLRRIEPWALGCLAFTMLDLMEGDVRFGLGASKGYGVAVATIVGIDWQNDLDASDFAARLPLPPPSSAEHEGIETFRKRLADVLAAGSPRDLDRDETWAAWLDSDAVQTLLQLGIAEWHRVLDAAQAPQFPSVPT